MNCESFIAMQLDVIRTIDDLEIINHFHLRKHYDAFIKAEELLNFKNMTCVLYCNVFYWKFHP